VATACAGRSSGCPRPPAGIRNGGLLLALVALAAVVPLVDKPPETGLGRSVPGIFQHLPPPTGPIRCGPEVRVATPEVAVELPTALTSGYHLTGW
jgi:hypothetical protein